LEWREEKEKGHEKRGIYKKGVKSRGVHLPSRKRGRVRRKEKYGSCAKTSPLLKRGKGTSGQGKKGTQEVGLTLSCSEVRRGGNLGIKKGKKKIGRGMPRSPE